MNLDQLQLLVDKGIEMLENAAREIPDLEKLFRDRQQ